MNPVHVHLMLNHIPLFGAVVGFGLLAVALLKKSNELKRIALGFFVVIAVLSVPAYLTGEPSEHQLNSLLGDAKPFIEKHEEAAGVALGSVVALGIFGLLGLVLSRQGRMVPTWLAAVAVGLSIVAGGLTAWTANLGGQIRHTEIRSGNSVPVASHLEKEH